MASSSNPQAPAVVEGLRAWRRKQAAARFDRLVAALRSQIDECGRVEVKALAKFLLKREAEAYRRGTQAMLQRIKRDRDGAYV